MPSSTKSGPDMIAVLGSEPEAGAVSQPETTTLRLPGGNFRPLASPDPLHPLVIDEPAGPAQQLGNLAIAIAAILAGKLHVCRPSTALHCHGPAESCAVSRLACRYAIHALSGIPLADDNPTAEFVLA